MKLDKGLETVKDSASGSTQSCDVTNDILTDNGVPLSDNSS